MERNIQNIITKISENKNDLRDWLKANTTRKDLFKVLQLVRPTHPVSEWTPSRKKLRRLTKRWLINVVTVTEYCRPPRSWYEAEEGCWTPPV